MTEPTRRAPGRLADLALDSAATAGAGLITFGVWQIFQPAAFIMAGGFLLAAAWLVARKSA